MHYIVLLRAEAFFCDTDVRGQHQLYVRPYSVGVMSSSFSSFAIDTIDTIEIQSGQSAPGTSSASIDDVTKVTMDGAELVIIFMLPVVEADSVRTWPIGHRMSAP